MDDSTGYCFAPGSKVLLADGSRQCIEYLKRGDLVSTPGGPSAVIAIVECRRHSFVHKLATVRGATGCVTITPWYPYRLKGTKHWIRPVDSCTYTEYYMPCVYGIVLEAYHCIEVDGLEFPTLGHGMEDPVVDHRYFGTPTVIRSLQNQPGWDTGRPIFKNLVVGHNMVNGEINGWFDE
jgi:hypothetical protein